VDAPDARTTLTLVRTIAAGDAAEAARMIKASPELARATVKVAASRSNAEDYFLDRISHYVYAGDTALHIAAAAHQLETAKLLIAEHAPLRARNRRGAEPIHYAADAGPGGSHWDPRAQRSMIEYLIASGANPNACDDSGVAPLHRAVRHRSSEAVRALIESGAELRLMNKRGSTPLHLAVQNTGASNSGLDAAKEQQREIIEFLLQRGARPTDTDANGKTVMAAASGDWIRELLASSRG
jgi:ankyrin repeat protein